MGNRRDFLKKLGAGSAGAAVVSCGPVDGGALIPYLVPPDDLVPGQAAWYATTCRECPAGCGLLARVREGRVVKLEGNPDHPGNRGALCPRGQAGLQGLYDPDRLTGPLQRIGGDLQPVDWSTALDRFRELLASGPFGWIGHHVSGTLDQLVDELVASVPDSRRVRFEALEQGAVAVAWERLIGDRVVPSVDLSAADLIVSFGADFLETWLGNVGLTRQFAESRRPDRGRRARFVHLAPRRGLTGDNADDWISFVPGAEAVVAAALAAALLERLGDSLDADLRGAAEHWLGTTDRSPAVAAAGVDPASLGALADRLAAASDPVVLGGGNALGSPVATELETAVGLMALMLRSVGRTVLPGRPLPQGSLSPHGELLDLLASARGGQIGTLLLHHADPLHTLPPQAFVSTALEAATVVSFATHLDASTMLADLVLPDHAPLESWGDHELAGGVMTLQQPVMQPLHDTRSTGDVLLAVLRDSDTSMQQAVRSRWNELRSSAGVAGTPDSFWQAGLRHGGYFPTRDESTAAAESGGAAAAGGRVLRTPTGVLPALASELAGPDDGLPLLVFPTIHLYDGRGANRGWLQEAPDPVSKVSWDSWVELHPQTARELGVTAGDRVSVGGPAGHLEAHVVTSSGVRPGTVAMPLGGGHAGGGRLAAGRGVNPLTLLPLRLDAASGGLARNVARVRLQFLGRGRLPRTQLETHDHERGLARFVTLPALALERELPAEHADLYGEHEHAGHRWGMTIDLDACVGCGACEIACSAENNIPVVGPGPVADGREMSWIRIDRFESEQGIAFVPMLCQHCDNAPCETVCPVNATYHTEDGLNGMVYNRCVGTRYCSNNCPYKVRRFNWQQSEWPTPLDLQLNPEVTPRSVGVMEKCSFCVQRIREGERDARLDGRELADGDVTTACAQTCPASAIVFGDLNEPTSRVAAGGEDPRAYRIFEELNTKPAISYLARTRLGEE